jgi:arylformamidase
VSPSQATKIPRSMRTDQPAGHYPETRAHHDQPMHLVDLSHAIEHEMTTYPGLPGPQITDHLTFAASRAHYAEGTEFSIGRISLVANTGPYLDRPAHRFPEGHDLTGLPLERCADLPLIVIDAPTQGPIGAAHIEQAAVQGAAVLLRTGWDARWRTERYGDPSHPHLTADGAEALVGSEAALVGIDSVNIDDTATGERPAHTILLAAGVPVVEHLTRLDQLATTGARFTAVPPRISGLATFPVRAFAAVPRTGRTPRFAHSRSAHSREGRERRGNMARVVKKAKAPREGDQP